MYFDLVFQKSFDFQSFSIFEFPNFRVCIRAESPAVGSVAAPPSVRAQPATSAPSTVRE
jgi:hypothetical protein